MSEILIVSVLVQVATLAILVKLIVEIAVTGRSWEDDTLVPNPEPEILERDE